MHTLTNINTFPRVARSTNSGGCCGCRALQMNTSSDTWRAARVEPRLYRWGVRYIYVCVLYYVYIYTCVYCECLCILTRVCIV